MIGDRTVLYCGDNGKHEFWEDDESKILILRVHGESCWSVHRDYHFLFFCRSETEAASRLNLVLSPAKKWTKNGEKFVLEPQPHKIQS